LDSISRWDVNFFWQRRAQPEEIAFKRRKTPMSMKSKDEMIELTEGEEDPGVLTGANFSIEGENTARKIRALREADSAGKSKLGLPAPERNKARTRKPKSNS
jgi:hypothetical protein